MRAGDGHASFARSLAMYSASARRTRDLAHTPWTGPRYKAVGHESRHQLSRIATGWRSAPALGQPRWLLRRQEAFLVLLVQGGAAWPCRLRLAPRGLTAPLDRWARATTALDRSRACASHPVKGTFDGDVQMYCRSRVLPGDVGAAARGAGGRL